MHSRVKSRKALSWAARVGALAGVAVLLAGCQTANTPDSSGEPAAQLSNLQEFVDRVDAAKIGPTEFTGPTEAAPAPEKQKLGIIPCSAAIGGCNNVALAVQDIAENVLGWDVTIYDGQANTRVQNEVLQNAVSNGSDAIITIAVDPRQIQQGITQAQAAGIPIISMNDGTGSPNPAPEVPAGQVTYDIDVSPDYPTSGGIMADWIVADSQGNADALLVSSQEYTSNVVSNAGVRERLEECDTCTIEPDLYFTTDEITSGTLATRVVNYLQSNPNVNYVYASFDSAAAAIVPAINQAGLGDSVRVVSVVGDEANREFIRNDNVQRATVIELPETLAYSALDQTVRLLSDLPKAEPDNEVAAVVLLTKDNMIPIGETFPLAYDLEGSYRELWGR